MNFFETPKRQPLETRQQLLQATAETILEKGLSGMTLEGVAKSAGVSKGGLLHHFPSKQHLIDALLVDMHEQFLEKLKQIASEDPLPAGRRTRAYLKLATQGCDERMCQLYNILTVEARDNPILRQQWRELLTSLLYAEPDEASDPVTLAVVQLAIDGLWMAGIQGSFESNPELYQQIVERLDQMTRLMPVADNPVTDPIS